jgi:hypothetical protein
MLGLAMLATCLSGTRVEVALAPDRHSRGAHHTNPARDLAFTRSASGNSPEKQPTRTSHSTQPARGHFIDEFVLLGQQQLHALS